MNVIVSIVLCLAMLLGGGGNLPAEPASATTWAIRNVTLTLGGESVTLAPEARITAAAGSERAALHLEVESDGKTILPITLDAAPDALRFSLGNARAYNLSAAELEKLLTFANPEDAETLEIAADYIQSYGALIASMLHDPESVRQHEEAVQALLFERCATPEGETQVEIDGQTYPAQKLRLHSDFSMIDALRDCGWPELEAMMNGTLNLLNRTAGLSADSFEEFYASAASGGAQAMPAMPELLLTVAEAEDFTYYRYDGMNFESSANPTFALKTGRAESILRKDGATANVEMSLTANGTTMDISLDETLTGDPYDPDIIDVNCDVHITPDADSGASPMDFAVTCDAAKNAENKLDGALRVQYPAEINGAALPFDEFALSFAQGSESGATTIGLAATNAGETVAALDFDVLRAEAAPVDYFESAQIYEITTDALESDELNPLMMALMSDASQLSLDAMNLAQEPSVQEAAELIQRFAKELYASNAPGSVNYGEDEEPTAVNSLEEAAEIYQGVLPDYVPPEGYELTGIQARPEHVELHYANPAEDSEYTVAIDEGYASSRQTYICERGSASLLTAPLAEAYPMEDGSAYNAYATMPDGTEITFSFEDAQNPDELCGFLAGLTK